MQRREKTFNINIDESYSSDRITSFFEWDYVIVKEISCNHFRFVINAIRLFIDLQFFI